MVLKVALYSIVQQYVNDGDVDGDGDADFLKDGGVEVSVSTVGGLLESLTSLRLK